MTNVRTIKAYSTENYEIKRFTKINDQIYDTSVVLAIWTGLMYFVTMALLYGGMAATTYIAANLYEAGKISIGDISMFFLFMMQLLMNFAI